MKAILHLRTGQTIGLMVVLCLLILFSCIAVRPGPPIPPTIAPPTVTMTAAPPTVTMTAAPPTQTPTITPTIKPTETPTATPTVTFTPWPSTLITVSPPAVLPPAGGPKPEVLP